YAIVEGASNQTKSGIGLFDADVYSISNGHVSAIVSDISNQKLRPERRHLAAHQSVLRWLLDGCTPLPMSFGIIAGGGKEVERILSLNKGDFKEQFKQVHGKVEMGLHVSWDVPNIFDYFTDLHQELRSARDTYFGTHRVPSYEDKIELGRMFDRILSQDRENHTVDVENALSPYCSEIKRNKCRSEKEVMNLACLVRRKAESEFEKGIMQAANLFDNNFTFDYNGPWAPHNFVELNLEF
ncbi:GvpL/GvpF family gas vesicle protein, partial [bacterium]|nr:GvpL/GvpF family gas vesicle protein [bacterium]